MMRTRENTENQGDDTQAGTDFDLVRNYKRKIGMSKVRSVSIACNVLERK